MNLSRSFVALADGDDNDDDCLCTLTRCWLCSVLRQLHAPSFRRSSKKCGLVKNLLALAPRVQFEVMNESWCSMVMTSVRGGEGLKAFLFRKSSPVDDAFVLGTTRRSREKKTSIG